jgi:hypothetical protein
MKVAFEDPQSSFQALRMLGSAKLGEVLRTAERIVEGDFKSWHSEWLATAERVEAIGDSCSGRGHTLSAREADAPPPDRLRRDPRGAAPQGARRDPTRLALSHLRRPETGAREIREQGLPFRRDWEHVVTPIVDLVLERGDVDP